MKTVSIFLRGGLITWWSKKQGTVAWSSAKDGFIAVALVISSNWYRENHEWNKSAFEDTNDCQKSQLSMMKPS